MTTIGYQAIVIGTSAGGLLALSTLLGPLPSDYALPIIVVQHRSKEPRFLLEEVLQNKCSLLVQQIEEKESIRSGYIYVAPPDYHVLIENNYTFSLTSDEAILYSRPSIDVLFESAAQVYKQHLIGVLLSGSNRDGTAGMAMIKKYKGLTVAQNPEEAMFPAMPQTAIQEGHIMQVMNLKEIHRLFTQLSLPS